MSGVSAIEIHESLEELEQLLREQTNPKLKERLQVLYWLAQPEAPTITAIAKAIGKHRATVQRWLVLYREQGRQGMLEIQHSPGRGRVIPDWAQTKLQKRLEQAEAGFKSYGQVQQWLDETLGIQANYHTVYYLTRYRLKAKLKAARTRHIQQDTQSLEDFKKTLQPI